MPVRSLNHAGRLCFTTTNMLLILRLRNTRVLDNNIWMYRVGMASHIVMASKPVPTSVHRTLNRAVGIVPRNVDAIRDTSGIVQRLALLGKLLLRRGTTSRMTMVRQMIVRKLLPLRLMLVIDCGEGWETVAGHWRLNLYLKGLVHKPVELLVVRYQIVFFTERWNYTFALVFAATPLTRHHTRVIEGVFGLCVQIQQVFANKKLAAQITNMTFVNILHVALVISPLPKLFSTTVAYAVENCVAKTRRRMARRVSVALGDVSFQTALDIKLPRTRRAHKLFSHGMAFRDVFSQLRVTSKRGRAIVIGAFDRRDVGALMAIEVLVGVEPLSAVGAVERLLCRMRKHMRFEVRVSQECLSTSFGGAYKGTLVSV